MLRIDRWRMRDHPPYQENSPQKLTHYEPCDKTLAARNNHPLWRKLITSPSWTM